MRSRTGPKLAALLCVGTVLSGCSATPEPVARPAEPSSATRTAEASRNVLAATTACTVPDRFVGRDLTRLPVAKKLVALTFDAGANADAVPSILGTLQTKGVPATFFLTGNFVQQFPKKSRRIANLHLVGNHTMTHRDLTKLSDLAVRRQVSRAQTTILDGTGEDPRRFFRFPFGARDARTIGIVNRLCYVAFRWTVDSFGWKGTSAGMTAKKVADRVVNAATPGEIVLMHVGSNPDDGSMLDAKALPSVIDRLRAKGYSFVRLSRVMSAAP